MSQNIETEGRVEDEKGTSGERAIEGHAFVFPVVKEELTVERRVIDVAQVRVTKSVRKEQREIDEPVWHNEISVEHVAINQVVEAPPGIRTEGDVTIVPLLEQVLVVEKRLLLREELRITRRRVEGRARQSIVLRAEEVAVERMEIPRAAPAATDEQRSGQSPEKGSGT